MKSSTTITVQIKSGAAITLAEEAGQRVVYALASLAVSPVGAHLNVERVTDDTGRILWQNSTLIDFS